MTIAPGQFTPMAQMSAQTVKRIKSSFPPLSEDELEANLAIAKSDLWCIAVNNTRDLTFEGAYRIQYRLAMYKQGAILYDYIVELLRRMSLCMRWREYCIAYDTIRAVAHYMDRTYVVTHKLPDVTACALAAYDRPVARRWRHAIAIVRWEARLRKWRVPFVEAWLRPGGAGECALAKRFAENADASQEARSAE